MGGYIYSESLHDMVLFSFFYHGKMYEWNDLDCVYYNLDNEEDYLFEVPSHAKAKM